jgi:hypothetical protein
MGTFQIHSEQLELLRVAIRERKQVFGCYHGHHREFCFHILGLKEEKWHVLGWQFGGTSESGKLPNWRCVALDELTDISVMEGVWHRGYIKGIGRQYCVDWVDTIVDPAYAAVIAA